MHPFLHPSQELLSPQEYFELGRKIVQVKTELDQGRYSEPMMLARLLQVHSASSLSPAAFSAKYCVDIQGMAKFAGEYKQMRFVAQMFKQKHPDQFHGISTLGGSTDLQDARVLNQVRVLLFGMSVKRGAMISTKVLPLERREKMLWVKLYSFVLTETKLDILKDAIGDKVSVEYDLTYEYMDDDEERSPFHSFFEPGSQLHHQDGAIYIHQLELVSAQKKLMRARKEGWFAHKCKVLELEAWDTVKRMAELDEEICTMVDENKVVVEVEISPVVAGLYHCHKRRRMILFERELGTQMVEGVVLKKGEGVVLKEGGRCSTDGGRYCA